jgi:hypothetical protein
MNKMDRSTESHRRDSSNYGFFFVLSGRKEKFSPLEKEKSVQISKPTKDEKTFFKCVYDSRQDKIGNFFCTRFESSLKKIIQGVSKFANSEFRAL